MRRRRVGEEDKSEPGVEISHENVKETTCTCKTLCQTLCISTLGLYALTPLMLYLIPAITEQLVFLNLMQARNEAKSLALPTSEFGLRGTGTFYIECDDVKLGVWHILPESRSHFYQDDASPSDEELRRSLQDAEDVIIYFHGSSSSRASGENMHRRELYKKFQREGFHTISFDYRGFGDSSGWPSEVGLANDSMCILQWIINRVPPKAKTIVWGHSLGAAVVALSVGNALDRCDSDNCLKIDGVVLQGAFTNVEKGAHDSAAAQLFRLLYPSYLLEKILSHTLKVKQLSLATDENIKKLKYPILLLHAEDDDTIPFSHGQALYDIIKDGKQDKYRLIQFKASHGYSHNSIYKCPVLGRIVKDFIRGKDDPSSTVTVV